jgi:hypothetical protein
MRTLYHALLLLHPPEFRRRYPPEMMCIFDEAAGEFGAPRLIGDALCSLGRQWVLRSGLWKLALAVVAACVQVLAGGLIWLAMRTASGTRAQVAGLDGLIRLILALVGALVVLVCAASLWIRHFARRRAA